MPPHLHPRSRMTSSLFATTVVASFFVVAMPHLLPCPVPATRYADGEIMVDENGKRKRWRRKQAEDSKDGIVQFTQSTEDGSCDSSQRARRECPVPKPGGMLGEWLGFHKVETDNPKGANR
jgi:cytochrome c oxidase assembly factor 2